MRAVAADNIEITGVRAFVGWWGGDGMGEWLLVVEGLSSWRQLNDHLYFHIYQDFENLKLDSLII